MTDLGIDFAWSKPDPDAVVAAGYKFVIGYISHDDSKDLSKEQVAAYRAAGLQVYLVYETTADRALAGKAAGVSDALEAVSKAAQRGYPVSLPLFMADDTNTSAAAVSPYFLGAKTVLGNRTGGYGGIHVIDPLLQDGTIFWGWQASAWSNGEVSQHAHLYQRLRPTLPVSFGSFDEDVLLRPLPTWPEPQKDPTLLIYADGLDALTAAGIAFPRRVGKVTTSLSEARDAITRRDELVVLGGPAATNLGQDPKKIAGTAFVSGTATYLVGATAEDTRALGEAHIK